MTHADMVRLLAVVAALSPAQRIDTHTADAWHAVIGDLAAADALEAVRVVARRQPYIAPADIAAQVAATRAARLAEADRTFAPTCDPDDVDAYRRQLHAHRAAYAAGNPPAQRPALPAGTLPGRDRQALDRKLAAVAGRLTTRRRRFESQLDGMTTVDDRQRAGLVAFAPHPFERADDGFCLVCGRYPADQRHGEVTS